MKRDLTIFEEDGFINQGSIRKEIIIIDEPKISIPNLKTQEPDEIFHLNDTSVMDGYSITNIERTLRENDLKKIDVNGLEYDYYQRIYTYCFDLVKNGDFIEYFELEAKSLPGLRKKVKKEILFNLER
jgi:hypothetical protein